MNIDAPPAIFRASARPAPLYRPPEGDWALMDLQGTWSGRVIAPPPAEFVLEIDGRQAHLFDWVCQDYCVLKSRLPHPPLSWAAWSAAPPSLMEFQAESTSAPEGVLGWLLAEDCRVWLNGSPSPHHVGPEFGALPVPFWNGFASDKPAPWGMVPWKLEKLFDSDEAGKAQIHYERASSPELLSVHDAAGRSMEAAFRSVLGRVFFEVSIPDEADFLIFRRSYDAFHGMQRARVKLKGRMAGWWHQSEENRKSRWAQDDLILAVPNDVTGRRLEVSFEPPAGAPLFSIARIECWATIPQRGAKTSRIE